MQKGFAGIIILVVVLILAGLGGAYYLGKLPIKPTDNNPKACTEEAKQCPDGSYVGRTGPNCEFSPCSSVAPKIPNETANPDSIEANWQIYQNRELKYEFRYLPDWSETQGEFGSKSPFSIQRFKDGKLWIIVTGYISKAQLSTMGITYCGAYPEDKVRCESKQINESIRVRIDWGTEEDNQAFARIGHPNGGVVTFTLKPITPEAKDIFNQILSTFRFTN